MSATIPHRKLVKHYHEPGDLHELTFSSYRRQPLLTNDTLRRQLARCIDAASQELDFRLAAFVFMPEHVHLLVVPMIPEPKIDLYLARIKQPFSKWVKQQLVDAKSLLLNRLIVQERPGKNCFRFW
jgi:putative transposase